MPPSDAPPGGGGGDGNESSGNDGSESSDGESESDKSQPENSTPDSDAGDTPTEEGKTSSVRKRPPGVAALPGNAENLDLVVELNEEVEQFDERTSSSTKKSTRIVRDQRLRNESRAPDRSRTSSPGNLSFATADLWTALDTLGEEIDRSERFDDLVAGTATVLTGAFSTGYVVWTVRGGYLMAGMMSSIPSWRFIDPLPIFEQSLGSASQTDDPEKNPSLAEMVQKSPPQ